MVGEPGQDALELLVVGAADLEAAAPLVGDGEDAVDVREVAPPVVAAEPLGDGPRGAGRAIHGADHGDVVARADPAVGPEIAAEGAPGPSTGGRGDLGGVGVVAVEQVGRGRCGRGPIRPAAIGREAKPMIWPYLRTGSPSAMSVQGDLVPQGDRLADLDGRAADVQREPRGDRPRGDRHVVIAPEQDRPLLRRPPSPCQPAPGRAAAMPSPTAGPDPVYRGGRPVGKPTPPASGGSMLDCATEAS